MFGLGSEDAVLPEHWLCEHWLSHRDSLSLLFDGPLESLVTTELFSQGRVVPCVILTVVCFGLVGLLLEGQTPEWDAGKGELTDEDLTDLAAAEVAASLARFLK